MTLVPGGGCRRRRSLARPPLRTSCRAARSLTGHGLVPGHGPGVGAPALKCHNGRSGGTFNPWSRTAQGTGLWVSTLLVLIPAPPHCLGRVKQSPVGEAAGGPRPTAAAIRRGTGGDTARQRDDDGHAPSTSLRRLLPPQEAWPALDADAAEANPSKAEKAGAGEVLPRRTLTEPVGTALGQTRLRRDVWECGVRNRRNHV